MYNLWDDSKQKYINLLSIMYTLSTSGRSAPPKKEVLWNVQEPGDPYDIKKSMIATLPGQSNFMGDNLEIVCLLQAAQIQRLGDFLQIYKFKFKDLERVQLDRHSYEIQIKELTQKLAGLTTLRKENDKLKEFVIKQTAEIQSLQGSNSGSNELKYALAESIDKNNNLGRQNQEYRRTIGSLQIQVETLKKTIDQLERDRLNEIERVTMKIRGQASNSNQILEAYKLQVEQQLKMQDIEVKRQQQIIDLKNQELIQYREKIRTLEEQYRVERMGWQNKWSNRSSELIRQYENQIKNLQTEKSKLKSQIEQLNYKIRQQNRQYENAIKHKEFFIQELQQKIKLLEEEVYHLRTENSKEVTVSSQMHEQKIYELESRIVLLTQDIESTNSKLRAEAQSSRLERDERQRRNLELSAKIDQLMKENQELRNMVPQNTDYQRQISQLQSDKALAMQQVQRLNDIIRTKEAEAGRFRIIISENENLKSRINQIQRNWSSKHDLEINRIRKEYEGRVRAVSQSQGNELQGRLLHLEKQMDRINGLLRSKADEVEHHRSACLEWQSKYNQLELDHSHRFRTYEQNIQNLKRDIVEYQGKLRQLEANNSRYSLESSRKVNEHVQTISVLKSQNQNLLRKNNEMRVAISNFETELSRRGTNFQQNMTTLTRDNEQLRARLRDSEGRLTQITVEFETLNRNYKLKNEELIAMDKNYRNIQSQMEVVRRQFKQFQISVSSKFQGEVRGKYNNYETSIQNLTRDLEESRRRYIQLESRYKQMQVEYEKVGNSLRNAGQQIDILKQQNNQRENQTVNFQNEINVKINNYEQNIYKITRNNEDLQRKLTQNEILLKQRYEQYQRLEVNYRNVTQELENINRRYRQLEVRFSQTMEVDVVNRYKQYDSTIKQLTIERQELNRKIIELNNRLNQKTLQVNNLSPLVNQTQILKKTLEKYEFSINAYESQVNKRFGSLDQRVQVLTKENEDWKKRHREVEDRNNNLTRELERISAHVKMLEGENQQLKRRLQEAGDLSRIRVQLESKLNLTHKQLEKTNQTLRSKIEDYNKLSNQNRNIIVDLEATRKQQQLVESKYTYTLQNEVPQKYNSYEMTISELKKRVAELQNKNHQLNSQLQRMVSEVKVKGGQSNQLLNRYNNLVNEFEDFKRKTRENETVYNQTVIKIRNENEQMMRRQKITEKQLIDRYEMKLVESENRIKIMAQQIQRLNQTVALKNKELEKLNRGVKEYEITMTQRSEIDMKNRQNLQVTINNLRKQNQRLELALRNKNQQWLSNDARLRQQYENFKLKAHQQERSLVSRYQSENNRRVSTYEQSIQALNRQRQELHRKSIEYEHQIKNLMTQIERLNMLIRTRSEQLQKNSVQIERLRKDSQVKLMSRQSELSTVQAEILRLQSQNETLKKSLGQYEIHMQKIHGEFDKFKKVIEELQKERENLYQKNLVLSEEIERLVLQNEDLETQTKDVRLRLSDESSLQKRINEHLSLMVILFAEVESLRRRVVDKEKEVEKVRRSSLSPNILKH